MNETQVQVLMKFMRLGIRHLVVGAQAMRAYGIDRPTRDLDLWIARDEPNATAMLEFLKHVQNRPPLERLRQPDFRFTVGDPRRPDVDILTSVAGDPAFDTMAGRCVHRRVRTLDLEIVAPPDLVTIKTAAAEKQEADVAAGELSAEERRLAEGAARKERRDIMLIEMWIAANR